MGNTARGNNRRRGFRYERLAAKKLQKLLNNYGSERETWWAYRIPLSAGAIVIVDGRRYSMPGDVIVGCNGYGVQTVEVKSISKGSRRLKDILKHVKCSFLMIHQHRGWQYWYRSLSPNSSHPNGWKKVSEKEFLSRITYDIKNVHNVANEKPIIITPRPSC